MIFQPAGRACCPNSSPSWRLVTRFGPVASEPLLPSLWTTKSGLHVFPTSHAVHVRTAWAISTHNHLPKKVHRLSATCDHAKVGTYFICCLAPLASAAILTGQHSLSSHQHQWLYMYASWGQLHSPVPTGPHDVISTVDRSMDARKEEEAS